MDIPQVVSPQEWRAARTDLLAREKEVTRAKDADEWASATGNPLAGGTFDLVVDYAGFDTTQKALNAVRRGGTVVQVGLGKPTFTVITPTILGRPLVGFLGGFRGCRRVLGALRACRLAGRRG